MSSSGEPEVSLETTSGESVSTEPEQTEVAVKPKRVRKPKAAKETKAPKEPYTPKEVGQDKKGNVLFRGPLKGTYYIKDTKDGKQKKVYKVVKQSEASAATVKKPRASRKRKAETVLEGPESPSKKAKASTEQSTTEGGEIITVVANECMSHLLLF